MAARVSFTILILTVTKESMHLENHFVDVSTVLLHKMYYSISQVYLDSLKTQKNQTFSRGFFDKFCFLSVTFQYLFYYKLLCKRL